MTKTLFAGLLAASVSGLAFGGWAVRDYIANDLASKDEVRLAGSKVDFVLDRQLEALIAQIAHLERKPNKTAGEFEQLRYLREQLNLMRKVRTGK